MSRETVNNIYPSIPCIQLFDAEKSTSLGGGQYKIHWNDTNFNTSDFEYRSDGTIRCLTTGIYLLQATIPFQLTGTNIHKNILLYMRYNGDADIDIYSRGKMHCVGTNAIDYVQLSLTRVLYLKKDDTVELIMSVEDTNTILTSNLSSLIITYIPNGGFNNGSCGSILNRGIRR